MPYRGHERSGPACYRHPAAQASETCSRCRHQICEICLGFEYTRPHCPPCARRVQHRRKLTERLTAPLGAAFLAVVATALGYLAMNRQPFDYGIYAPEVGANLHLLDGAPCDRPAMLRLAQAVLKAGDERGAVEKIDAFSERCGEWPRLLWVSYSAHMRLAEFDAAVFDASRLITHQPDNADFWWWRAQAYELNGQPDDAIADYRRALSVQPALARIAFNLADLLERQGHLCEAAAPLEQFLEHRGVPNVYIVEERIQRLQHFCARQ